MSKETIAEFRARHSDEKENTLKMFISIRDSDEATNKERTEAGKAIMRSLGALQPDKVSPASSKPKVKEMKLNPEQSTRIDSILAEQRETPVQ